MNIIPLFQSLVNHLSKILVNNLFLHELEHNISNSTIELNLDILKQILEYLDLEYKNSKERKNKYYVQQTRERTLITSLGLLTFNKTYYKSKNKINGKYKYYSYLEDYLGVAKWAKMTLAAEVLLVNNALDNGYTWSGNNSIPNYIITRQTISSKIQSINFNYIEQIKKKKLLKLFTLKLMKFMLISNPEIKAPKIESFLLFLLMKVIKKTLLRKNN
jgi:hypothetical protein